jgi:hypothetical protein
LGDFIFVAVYSVNIGSGCKIAEGYRHADAKKRIKVLFYPLFCFNLWNRASVSLMDASCLLFLTICCQLLFQTQIIPRDFMKKDNDNEMDDELRPEYNFSQLGQGVRGKYVERY